MQILYISLLTVITSAIGTISGFGISTLMVPIISFFMPLTETIFFVGVVHWFGDVWKIFIFKKGLNTKIILAFGVPGVIFSFIGAKMLLTTPTDILSRFIGTILIVYVCYLLIKPKFKIKPNITSALVGGGLSGLLGGITGVGGGALRAVVLTSFNLSKEVYVYTTGLVGATVDASRIVGYFTNGTLIQKELLFAMPIFVFASWLGVKIAKVMVDKIPQEKFRWIIATFLFLISLKFILIP